jgi:hypothetical protein
MDRQNGHLTHKQEVFGARYSYHDPGRLRPACRRNASMKPLESPLEHKKAAYNEMRETLGGFGFSLGGNWEYDHGYFDRPLDEAHKVWLRIPFQVERGSADLENEDTDATVEVGKPFVLKHVYNEGLDPEAEAETYGAMLDQFQAPTDADAGVESEWIAKGAEVLREVERNWQQ